MENNKRFNDARRLGNKSNMWARIANVAGRISRIADAKANAYEYEQSLAIEDILESYNAMLMEIEKYNIEKHRKEFKIEP